MENPRPEKVAVVEEVKERMNSSSAALLTEYRGLTVADMQALRRSLREAGGDYTIYKNSLVRFAARDLELEIEDLLIGPTAIAFVPSDGPGDPVPVAKVLKDFSRTNAHLVVKGGVLGDKILSAEDARALADVAPREVLLAQIAGAIAAPMQQFAGLLNALPQKFAYAMQALIDQGSSGSETSAPASEREQGSDSPPDAELEEPIAEAADPAQATEETEAAEQTEPQTEPQSEPIDAPADSGSTDSGSSDSGSNTEAS